MGSEDNLRTFARVGSGFGRISALPPATARDGRPAGFRPGIRGGAQRMAPGLRPPFRGRCREAPPGFASAWKNRSDRLKLPAREQQPVVVHLRSGVCFWHRFSDELELSRSSEREAGFDGHLSVRRSPPVFALLPPPGALPGGIQCFFHPGASDSWERAAPAVEKEHWKFSAQGKRLKSRAAQNQIRP